MDKTAFVVSIAPAARAVATRTGLSYELILAQAVQETGWGTQVFPNSYNIFGIKADRSWTGPTVMGWTHEVVNGVRVRVREPFRVYANYEEAIEDRVRFLQTNPRYAGLFAPGVMGDYAKEAAVLQSAGYATDRAYAANLVAVVRGPTMQRALALVPTSPQQQPYYADPATHTQAQLAAMGLGPTGYRLGEHVPSATSYSRWTRVDGNYILEMWDGAYFNAAGSTLPAAKILYFDANMNWTGGVRLENGTYVNLPPASGRFRTSADGTLVLQVAGVSSLGGIVLSGDDTGTGFSYVDNTGTGEAGIVNASFSDDAPTLSSNYVLIRDEGGGRRTEESVEPVTRLVGGVEVVVGYSRTLTVYQDNAVLSTTVTTQSTDAVGNVVQVVDAQVRRATGEFESHVVTEVTTSPGGLLESGRTVREFDGSNGLVRSTTTTLLADGGSQTTVTVGGTLLSSTTARIFDDGSSLYTTTFADGTMELASADIHDQLYERTVTHPLPGGNEVVERYTYTNGQPVLQERRQVEYFYDENGVSRIETVTTADGVYRNAYDSEGVPAGSSQVSDQGLNAYRFAQAAGVLNDVNALLGAIRAGQPIPIIAGGLRIVSGLDPSNGTLASYSRRATVQEQIARDPTRSEFDRAQAAAEAKSWVEWQADFNQLRRGWSLPAPLEHQIGQQRFISDRGGAFSDGVGLGYRNVHGHGDRRSPVHDANRGQRGGDARRPGFRRRFRRGRGPSHFRNFGINSGTETDVVGNFARRIGFVPVGENFVKELARTGPC